MCFIYIYICVCVCVCNNNVYMYFIYILYLYAMYIYMPCVYMMIINIKFIDGYLQSLVSCTSLLGKPLEDFRVMICMKLVVAEKYSCYWIYIKANTYLFIIIII